MDNIIRIYFLWSLLILRNNLVLGMFITKPDGISSYPFSSTPTAIIQNTTITSDSVIIDILEPNITSSSPWTRLLSSTKNYITKTIYIPVTKISESVTFKILQNLSYSNNNNRKQDPFHAHYQIMEPYDRAEENPFDIAKAFKFEDKFIMNIQKLEKTVPKSLQLDPAPWPSVYLPNYEDGPNFDWNNDGWTPIKKYAKAFDIPFRKLRRRVSYAYGVFTGWESTKDVEKIYRCKRTKECQERFDDEMMMCGHAPYVFLPGEEPFGICVASWQGGCHNLAPASYQEPEPKCSVTHNGIKFEILDIKILLTLLYNTLADDENVSNHLTFLGLKCLNGHHEIIRDNFGRPTNFECRSLNAGVFHVVLLNMLGLMKRPMVIDREPYDPVWNHPVFAYTIHNSLEISERVAAGLFGVKKYPFNSAAKRFRFVNVTVWYTQSLPPDMLREPFIPHRVAEASDKETYQYVVELDSKNEVIGGEWVGESILNHVDFIWAYNRRPALNAVLLPFEFRDRRANRTFVDGIRYANVKMLLDKSLACGASVNSGGREDDKKKRPANVTRTGGWMDMILRTARGGG